MAKATTYTCDNYCGSKQVSGNDNGPFGWTKLTLGDQVTSWIFCSRPCLLGFLYKSKHSLSLGTQVKADIVGERVTETETDVIVATGA